MRERMIVLATAFLLLQLILPASAEKTETTCTLSGQDGHYHGDVKYEPWPGTDGQNRLPQQGGYYYLTNDIVRDISAVAVTIAAGSVQHLCLNGYTITHRSTGNRLYDIKGEFYLEDCSGHTDDRGAYISGGITYGGTGPNTRSYGGLFSLQRGGSMTMTGGQIYGLSSNAVAGAAVYVQGASTTAKAVFSMQGGQIHSNSAQAICMEKATFRPATENFSQVNICGGKIWGNRTGISVTGDVLNITGGVITENGADGPAVSVGAGAQVRLSGCPEILGNPGGNLYLAGDAVMELGQLDAAARIGIGAETAGRAISTCREGIPLACFQSDDPQLGISIRQQQLYLGHLHEHALADDEPVHWIKWTGTDSLPSVSGNYYLEYDVQLTNMVVLNDHVQLDLCLNGRTVTAPQGKRVMTVGSGCQVNITDCCLDWGVITGGSSAYGGGFYVMHGGTLALYRGTITQNNADEAGGAVYLQAAREDDPGGRFQMYGGQILENTAKLGGGIYTAEASTLLLAGGSVTQNRGGGVYVSGSVQVRGSPVVADNTGGNLCLQADVCVTAGQLEPGARLFVSCAEGDRPITDAGVDAVTAGCFFSDSPYWVIRHDTLLYLNMTGEHTHCLCAAAAQDCDHQTICWQAWESTTALPEASGYYYLTEDVQLTERAAVLPGQQIHLCLNGHTVTAAQEDRLFQVHNQGYLTITDCVGSGKLTGGCHDLGGAINIMHEARADLYGGTVTGNTAGQSGMGGAIYVQGGTLDRDGGVFYMYGGCIAENTGMGGAIYAQGSETGTPVPARVVLYGGTFRDNTAQNSGGAIYAGKNCQLVICGVTFSGNWAQVYGGAIYCTQTDLEMTGGSLLRNRAASGGGICLSGGRTVISGTVICGNSAEKTGGGVAVSQQAQLFMDGCQVETNRAGGKGAGIYQAEGTLLSLKDSRILGNEGTDTGSALYAGGEFVLDGCLITGNKTTKGAAVYVASIRSGERKLGGDLQIHSNQGTMEGDLYFSKGVVAIATAAGFGVNTRIRIQLYSGFVTDAVLAAYDYVGGNRVYIITYGTRSITDPEKEPEPEAKQSAGKTAPAAAASSEEGSAPKAAVTQDTDLPGTGPLEERRRSGIWGMTVLLAGGVFTVLLLRSKKPKSAK